jgi:hypothetical protein
MKSGLESTAVVVGLFDSVHNMCAPRAERQGMLR